jgi:hypothetical protein
LHPFLLFFPAVNGEWALWNESKGYLASKHGYQFLGWHINRGKGKEAKWIPVKPVRTLPANYLKTFLKSPSKTSETH